MGHSPLHHYYVVSGSLGPQSQLPGASTCESRFTKVPILNLFVGNAMQKVIGDLVQRFSVKNSEFHSTFRLNSYRLMIDDGFGL